MERCTTASQGPIQSVMRGTIRRASILAIFSTFAVAAPAAADVTAFLGYSPKPAAQTMRGFAFGLNLLVVGFELEYANAPENLADAKAGLITGMINGLVQTPTSSTQFYLTAGGGLYRERLGTASETSFGTNVGGGVKLGLAGPLRLRLDYRVYNLRGTPIRATPQRLYAGLNLSF
jgi:hypothetical protein